MKRLLGFFITATMFVIGIPVPAAASNFTPILEFASPTGTYGSGVQFSVRFLENAPMNGGNLETDFLRPNQNIYVIDTYDDEIIYAMASPGPMNKSGIYTERNLMTMHRIDGLAFKGVLTEDVPSSLTPSKYQDIESFITAETNVGTYKPSEWQINLEIEEECRNTWTGQDYEYICTPYAVGSVNHGLDGYTYGYYLAIVGTETGRIYELQFWDSISGYNLPKDEDVKLVVGQWSEHSDLIQNNKNIWDYQNFPEPVNGISQTAYFTGSMTSVVAESPAVEVPGSSEGEDPDDGNMDSNPSKDLSKPHELTGGSNLSKPCPQTCAGDPINVANGEFWLAASDVTNTNGYMPFTFERYYSISQRETNVGLGNGWTHNFSMQLRSSGEDSTDMMNSENLVLTQENGSQLAFTQEDNGEWASSSPTATLTEVTDGFVFARDKETSYHFNNKGHLISVRDTYDNAINLIYENDLLTIIQSSWGQEITLDRNASNSIVSIVSDGKEVSYQYDMSNNLTEVGINSRTTSYDYDSENRLIALSDFDGFSTQNEYDELDRVVLQTNPDDSWLKFSYQENKTILKSSDGTTKTMTFDPTTLSLVSATTTNDTNEYYEVITESNAYDTEGRLLSAEVNGLSTFYTWDENSNLLTKTLPSGKTIETYTYDARNKPLTSTDGNGHTTSYEYDSAGNLVKTSYPNGRTVEVVYNSSGLPTEESVYFNTDPSNVLTTQYSYTDMGLIESTTSPAGGIETFTYDPSGRIVSHKNAWNNLQADGQPTTYVYDNFDNVTTVTTPTGKQLSYDYSPEGYLNKYTDADGGQWSYQIDYRGLVTQITDPLSNVTLNEYDFLGNLISETSPEGGVTTMKYSPSGLLRESTDADGKVTRYFYNNYNHLVSVEKPTGEYISFTYDVDGNMLSESNHGTIAKEYDGNNQLISESELIGSYDTLVKTTYSYDEEGNLRTTNEHGVGDTTYSYTPDLKPLETVFPDGTAETWDYEPGTGKLVSQIDKLGKITSFTVNNADLVTASTLPSSDEVTYTYDLDGSLIRTSSDQDELEVTYEYDNAGRRISATSEGRTDAYTYDAVGNLTSSDSSDSNNEVRYKWNGNSDLSSLEYPSGLVVEYSRDELGRATEIGIVQDEHTSAISMQHSASGVQRIQYPNEVTQSYQYWTGLPEYMGLQGPELDHLYSTDLAHIQGFLIYRNDTDSTWNSHSQNYEYGTAYRLTEASSSAGDYGHWGSYNFDASGNVTNDIYNSTLSYNDTGQLASLSKGNMTNTYTYDTVGNRKTFQVGDTTRHEYQYDARNRLTDIVLPSASKEVEYTYNTSGLLSSKEVISATNSTKGEWVWDESQTVPRLLTDGVKEYVYGDSETPLAQIDVQSGDIEYLHSEPQVSSIVAVTDELGEIVDSYSYDAYGNQDDRVTSDPTHSTTAFGFAGQYMDSDTGLYYLRARWMDTQTMSFLSVDPLLSETAEAYSYASGNPTALVDPMGLFSWNPMDTLKSVGNGISKAAKKIGKVAVDTWNDPAKLDMLSTGLGIVAIGANFIPGAGQVVSGLTGMAAATLSARSAYLHASEGDLSSAIVSGLGVVPTGGIVGGKGLSFAADLLSPYKRATSGSRGVDALTLNQKVDRAYSRYVPRHATNSWRYRFTSQADNAARQSSDIGSYVYTPTILTHTIVCNTI